MNRKTNGGQGQHTQGEPRKTAKGKGAERTAKAEWKARLGYIA